MKDRSNLPLLLLFTSVSLSSSFIIPPNNGLSTVNGGLTASKKSSLISMNLANDDKKIAKDDKKRTGGLDPTVRNKLLAESIAPWRTLRKFLYASAGSGALLGGIITLTGAIAAFAGARPDLDMNTEYLNLAIDFGFVAIFAVAWKLDSDQGAELDDAVLGKIEKKKEQKKLVRGMRERESKLQQLSLNVQTSLDGSRTDGKISDVQLGAKQNMIIVVGPRDACRKALVGANIMSNQFGMSNVLVVPYDTGIGADMQAEEMSKTGFGKRGTSGTRPWVARPIGFGWESYIKAEMDDAVKQSGEKCREDGIAIVVEKTGRVMRRGVGEIPWRDIIDEFNGVEDEELPLIGFS